MWNFRAAFNLRNMLEAPQGAGAIPCVSPEKVMRRAPALLLSAALFVFVLAASPAAAIDDVQRLDRADGSRITYHVTRPAEAGRQGVVLLLHGSGCDPVGPDREFTARASSLAPGDAVLTVESYGVTDAQAGLVEGCTAAYWERNTLQQRVMDAAQVIARLRREPWWNGRIVIAGFSEGGAVAAMLAPLVPETRAVVIFSSGIGVPVGDLIRAAIPPQAAAEAPRIFAEARANPTGSRRWGGASYRWWADAVEIVPASMLLQTSAPILLIHGSRDPFAPVATARATRELLARHGRRNFTYREYAGYDHFMRDAAGNDHRPEVLVEAAGWLRQQGAD